MSSIVISGDTSGAITLAAPAVSGTNTATLPAATGTVMVSGAMPAFAAYSNQSTALSNQTPTKLQFNLTTFNLNSNYNTSTYSFTPTVAGYYQISACFSPANNRNSNVSIYFNNSLLYTGSTSGGNFAGNGSNISCLIYFNGSTDHVECYGTVDGGSSTLYNANGWSWFQGVMVRAA
jgi:hypothetical protein